MKTKEVRGITIISLVVTIVVLLILAGISINAVIGDNGIIKKAQNSAISNEWKDGDIIDITIPMSVTVYNSRIDGQAAYQYGPVVLAADLGSVSNVSGVNEYISNETKIDSVTTDVPYIVGNSSNLDKYIDTVDTDKLMFKIKAENSSTGKDI